MTFNSAEVRRPLLQLPILKRDCARKIHQNVAIIFVHATFSSHKPFSIISSTDGQAAALHIKVVKMTEISLEDVIGSSPKIAQSLRRKAVDHNDQLTKVERMLLLSRLDLAGKTLADPKSLTDTEVDQILGRPPPAVLRANIKLLTGLDSIAEVMRDFWSPDRTEKLNYDTLECISRRWWTPHSDEIYDTAYLSDDDEVSGVVEAASELGASLRPEEVAFEEAATSRFLSSDSEHDENVGTLFASQKQTKSEEEWSKETERRLQEHKDEAARLRKELEGRLGDELKSTTEEDIKAFAELRKRMEVEFEAEEEEDDV